MQVQHWRFRRVANLCSAEGSRRWIVDSSNIEVGESTVGAGGMVDLVFSRLKDIVEFCDYFQTFTY